MLFSRADRLCNSAFAASVISLRGTVPSGDCRRSTRWAASCRLLLQLGRIALPGPPRHRVRHGVADIGQRTSPFRTACPATGSAGQPRLGRHAPPARGRRHWGLSPRGRPARPWPAPAEAATITCRGPCAAAQASARSRRRPTYESGPLWCSRSCGASRCSPLGPCARAKTPSREPPAPGVWPLPAAGDRIRRFVH